MRHGLPLAGLRGRVPDHTGTMIGDTLGSYVIEQAIGAGGMGQVFLGVHRRIGRRVAIKLLLPEYSASPALLGRFFTEARATSLINHPGIVQILDCDVHPSGRAYIIMEYLYGESLRGALGRVGRMVYDLPAVISIMAQVAEAVGAAHDKGIVHRDLKPDNIFLLAHQERERIPAKVLDFGVAKLLGTDGDGVMSNTRTGSLLGTPLYMSPEQCRSAGSVDYRSDIYSLGCICFEALCGRPPFEGRGVTDLLIAHASHAPPAPSSLGIDVPDQLEQMVMSMLAKEPGDRPSTMGEVSSMLRAMVDWLPPAVSPFQVQPPSLGAENQSRTAILPVAVSPLMYTPSMASRPAPTPLPPHTTLEQSTGTLDAPDRLRRAPGRRGWMFPVAAALVAILGVGAYLFSDELIDHGHARRTPGEEAEGETTPGRADPPTGARAAALPATITVDVESAPDGLKVTVDGDLTSLPVRLSRDGSVHKLLFKVPGYQPETRIIEASKSQIVALSLKPIKDDTPPDDPKTQGGVRPTIVRPPPIRRRYPPPTSATAKPTRGSEVIIEL
jgi:serine/threonine protein kinase